MSDLLAMRDVILAMGGGVVIGVLFIWVEGRVTRWRK